MRIGASVTVGRRSSWGLRRDAAKTLFCASRLSPIRCLSMRFMNVLSIDICPGRPKGEVQFFEALMFNGYQCPACTAINLCLRRGGAAAVFNVFIKLSVVYVVPHFLDDRLIAAQPSEERVSSFRSVTVYKQVGGTWFAMWMVWTQ
ncbi:hypothetical protein E2553_27770 [Paraburkholderia dipogonis]|uniref:Uncharacterized protein n=1 Tax=Paraburkholderia dipogonis TaxID=1211383 RepID=A0A4Y8MSY0_9BURK|nr:hypothetical protein [Paraburkholderia dipogonis]TFE40529.1 hypothetical protein E2553_27770 [Paraburkholderia dipogonis]